MRILYSAVLFAFVIGSRVAAQSPAAACSPQAYFEFQVAEPAVAIADTTSPIKLTGSGDRRPVNLVQFVVDTSGRAEVRSFKMLRVADSVLVKALYEQLSERRFVPAKVGACRVRQMYQ